MPALMQQVKTVSQTLTTEPIRHSVVPIPVSTPPTDMVDDWESHGHRGDAAAFILWFSVILLMQVMHAASLISGMFTR